MQETQMELLNILYNALYEEYDRPREGTHVSDVLLCPRKKCYEKIDPLPLNNVQLNFFTSGKAIHGALQTLVKKYPHRFEIEKEVKLGELEAHIDIFDKELGMPIEAKSARIADLKEEDLFGRNPDKKKSKIHFVRQLEAYMAMTDSDKGKILVQCLLHFGDTPFLEFNHTMTKAQREQTLAKLTADAILLKQAIERKDPNIARHIAYEEEYNWQCRYCPYAKECEALRTKEREGMFPK